MTTHASQISDRFSAEWLAGYRAALADLDCFVASLGGPTAPGVAPYLRARLTAHLVEREGVSRAA